MLIAVCVNEGYPERLAYALM
jgi:uncharacterized membrane protein YukC